MNKILWSLFLVAFGIILSTVYLKKNSTPLVVSSEDSSQSSSTAGVFSYAPAVKRAKPAVVNINTSTLVTQRNRFFEDPVFNYLFGGKLQPKQKLQNSLGSGVLVSAKGYILTNYHVIKDADKIKVSLNDGRTATAKLVGVDVDTDLAVLKINLVELPEIIFGNSKLLEVGDVVLAIGNPFGVGQTVTMGIVSAKGRSQLGISNLEDFIQTDAAINPGNSGGALVNARGELVGINTAIFSKTGASLGIGFAIPSAMARHVLESIVNNGKVVRGWIGVETQDLTPELARSFGLLNQNGVIVSGVYRGSPAEKTGIRPGDILLKLDATVVNTASQWKAKVIQFQPKDALELTFIRKKQKHTVLLTVGRRPDNIR